MNGRLSSGEPEREQSRWVQVDPLPAHCQVQMWARGAPGAAAKSHLLTFDNALPFLHTHLGEVQVESEKPLAMVNHNAVPFKVE